MLSFMKICNNPNCEFKGELLPLTGFNKNKTTKDGFSNRCKKCVNKSVKQSYKKNSKYYSTRESKRFKEKRKENPLKYQEIGRKYNQRLKENGYFKDYYQQNKEKFKQYSQNPQVIKKRNKKWKERYKIDKVFKLKEIMKSNFHLFFKDKGQNKNLSFNKIINYTYEELKIHLENNFRKGMNWGNFGELWEIHHIKPQNQFNPDNLKEIEECWALFNLTPLWKTTQISQQMGDTSLGNRNVPKNLIYKP
jgi:hypothetical protein